jgi:hypothetical protein
MLGYILGTAVGGLLGTVTGRVEVPILGAVELTAYNSPTFCSAAAALLLLALGLRGFARREAQHAHERAHARAAHATDTLSSDGGLAALLAPVSPSGSPGGGGGSGDDGSGLVTHGGAAPPAPPPKPNRSLVQALVIVLYCSVAAMYNAVETTSTPMTNAEFGWGVRENAFLWTCSGASLPPLSPPPAAASHCLRPLAVPDCVFHRPSGSVVPRCAPRRRGGDDGNAGGGAPAAGCGEALGSSGAEPRRGLARARPHAPQLRCPGVDPSHAPFLGRLHDLRHRVRRARATDACFPPPRALEIEAWEVGNAKWAPLVFAWRKCVGLGAFAC